ncbi:CLUMA_CG001189, isoform A [Clunio marinus]|uniref:CLUMA_CG001189, isoform A n=1 Tax=Clunio marinus TaxID=568069 RepID=A0A1J1HHM5_9DIPT|nr:CLUMA_CG001189, isoform A [Clunio marinus]
MEIFKIHRQKRLVINYTCQQTSLLDSCVLDKAKEFTFYPCVRMEKSSSANPYDDDIKRERGYD